MKAFSQLSNINSQNGAALITALVMLVLLTLLGLNTMTTATLEERMASNSQEISRSFHAAETGLSAVLAGGDTLNTSSVQTGSGTVGTYNSTVSYSSEFRQAVPMGRSSVLSQLWEAGEYEKYYFDVEASGTTGSGVTTSLDAGTFQIAASN